MNNAQKTEILKQHPLFRDIKVSEVATIAESVKEKIFPPKTLILSQSEPASAVYLIHRGLIKIYILNEDGKMIPIRVKEPMYIFGEMNIFDDESSATIETIQETHALVFTKQSWKKLIMEHPTFAFNLLKILNEKLRAANIHANQYFSLRLKDRTLTILQTLSQHFPKKEITLSQEELSQIVGASRARVTEVLNELSVENLVHISHRKITIP